MTHGTGVYSKSYVLQQGKYSKLPCLASRVLFWYFISLHTNIANDCTIMKLKDPKLHPIVNHVDPNKAVQCYTPYCTTTEQHIIIVQYVSKWILLFSFHFDNFKLASSATKYFPKYICMIYPQHSLLYNICHHNLCAKFVCRALHNISPFKFCSTIYNILYLHTSSYNYCFTYLCTILVHHVSTFIVQQVTRVSMEYSLQLWTLKF